MTGGKVCLNCNGLFLKRRGAAFCSRKCCQIYYWHFKLKSDPESKRKKNEISRRLGRRKLLAHKKNDSLIVCLECGVKLKRITNTHLKYCSNLSMTEYSKKHQIPRKELLWLPERENHSNKMIGVGNSMYGKHHKNSTLAIISKKATGRPNPKLSESRLRLKKERGYLQSPEARKKQSDSLKRKFKEDEEWSKKRRKQVSDHFKK